MKPHSLLQALASDPSLAFLRGPRDLAPRADSLALLVLRNSCPLP